MLYLHHGHVILSVCLTFIKMISKQSSEILRTRGENGFVTKEFESIHEEDDIHELSLYPGHEWELDTVPGPEQLIFNRFPTSSFCHA